jgi:hypothetical protein
MDNLILFVTLLELFLLFQMNLYLIVLVVIGYAWWYLDGKEYTGEGRSDGLRNFSFWKHVSPVIVKVLNTNLTQTARHLYIFNTCATITPMFWAIGLHGTTNSFFVPDHAINYLVPPIYMWIPFLRDFLKWTGAVTWSKTRLQNTVIKNLLRDGRSVAYSPGNFVPVAHQDIEVSGNNFLPPDDILELCLEQHIKIVLVNVRNETKRYAFLSFPSVIQNWIYEKTGHYFPILYWKRFGPHSPLIEVDFELGFDSGKDYTLDSLREALNRELQVNFKTK